MEITEQYPLGSHPYGMQSEQSSKERLALHQSQLAQRLQQGERTAAEELAERYYRQIFLYLRELGHSRETSEDLTQDVFFRAWHRIHQLRSGRALSAWIFRIASNLSREHWRKVHRREITGQERVNLATPEISQERGQDEYAGRLEEVGQLMDAVSQLPWKLRQAVVLHYLQGFTISEAALVADVKEGTFKSRLNRGLEALRNHMYSEGHRQ